MKKEFIEFKCIAVKQPIGQFYIGVMNYDDVVYISYVDIMRLETGSEMREVEIYSGIQRELNESRASEIGKYVTMIDATFPTSIILHLAPDSISFDSREGIMKIPFKNNVAKVLDGQHRIRGFKNFKEPSENFQLNITLFVGMELEEQAIVFATINQTQTKVNRSLVANLFQFAINRSPQKTAHQIVRALNEKEGSPFKDKIKILGSADDKEKETITQATFVDNILQYITKDKATDRDIYKRGKKPMKYSGEDAKKYFLRDLFLDEKDGEIAKIIWNYFAAIQKKWPKAWNQIAPQMILNRTTGFTSLMRFFKDIYLNTVKDNIGGIPSIAAYLQTIDKISLKDEDFNKENFKPGGSGIADLYKRLLYDSKINK
jgi:DGQHR domain-containing protein